MKLRISMIFLSTTMVTSLVWADAKCVADVTDPYDPGVVMSIGKYKGQCMDASEMRALVIVSEDETQISFANFYHDKHFWIAQVPTNGVDKVLFQTEYFTDSIPFVKPAHVEIRVLMKPGYEATLFPQAGKDQGLAPIQMADFSFSNEYMAPSNVDYSILGGELKEFKDATTARSTQAVIADLIDDNEGEVMSQYNMKLTDEEKSALLVNAVHQSQDIGYKFSYSTLKLNCATELFDIFDATFTYAVKPKPFKISIFQFRDPVAKPALQALTARGLIDDQSEVPSLNSEFGFFDGTAE